MANTIKFKRGTAANLSTLAGTSGLIAGEPYFITDQGRIAIGLTTSTYQTFAKLSEILANPMTTAGDLIYGGASGAATRLAGSTSGYVLTSTGPTSAPVWAASGGGSSVTIDDTVPSAPTVGSFWLRPADGVLSVYVPTTTGYAWFSPVGSAGPAGAAGTSQTVSGTSLGIQYNNASALASASNAQIVNNTLYLLNATPATPAAGGSSMFSKTWGGRSIPSFITDAAIAYALQPSLAYTRISQWEAAGNSTVITAVGGQALTATGTATAANVAVTNAYTQSRLLEYLVTVAATTAVAGWRAPASQWLRGNAAGLGGFHFVCQFGPSTGVATTTNRCFVGMSANTAAPTDVEASTLVNMCGFGWDAADTNIQFMVNGASGTATKTDLGSNFPVPTVDRTKRYEAVIFCKPNDTTLYWEFKDIGTGNSATGNTSTNLPVNTTYLSPRGYLSVGGTSSVIGIALAKLYIESP